jgi:hypothetical protein
VRRSQAADAPAHDHKIILLAGLRYWRQARAVAQRVRGLEGTGVRATHPEERGRVVPGQVLGRCAIRGTCGAREQRPAQRARRADEGALQEVPAWNHPVHAQRSGWA